VEATLQRADTAALAAVVERQQEKGEAAAIVAQLEELNGRCQLRGQPAGYSRLRACQ